MHCLYTPQYLALFVHSAVPCTVSTLCSTLHCLYMLQYLTELEYSGVNRNKEQSGRMLGHLISKAPQLIRPYMQPILAVLIPKLKEPDQNLGVVISILTAVGDIALVCQLILYLIFGFLMPPPATKVLHAGVMVKVLDLRLKSCEFDSQPSTFRQIVHIYFSVTKQYKLVLVRGR